MTIQSDSDLDIGARILLGRYPLAIKRRGRVYAMEGRVHQLCRIEGGIAGVVEGTDAYRVALTIRGRTARPDCTCPAFARASECKHIAALAWTITGAHEGGDELESFVAPAPLTLVKIPAVDRPALPAVFAAVYSTESFFWRLSLHRGTRIEIASGPYLPLAEWWRRSAASQYKHHRAFVLEVAPQVEAIIETLRAWRPGPSPLPKGSAYTTVYDKLVALYVDKSEHVRVGALVPGPLDARHPGFEVAWVARKKLLDVRERPMPLDAPRGLAVVIGFDQPGNPISFEGSAFAAHGPTDAWDLFALRAMILALESRSSEAVLALERDLERPAWEHLLERFAPRKPAVEREWGFSLSPLGRDFYGITAFARPLSAGGKWKKERFETLFDEDVLPVERDIARIALVGDRAGKNGSAFALGTPHGHELLRYLAQHPRVFLAARYERTAPDMAMPVTIVAGQLTMSLDHQKSGAIVPSFRVDGAPVVIPRGELTGDKSSAFRAAASLSTIYSFEIPRPLRTWLDSSLRFGDELVFPAEATPRLVSMTQPLVSAGIVEVPRAALGEELPYDPRPALRVEWCADEDEPLAMLEVMIQVHREAPFVAAGRGPRLFTFERGADRVFVERDKDRELQIAGECLDRIDANVEWLEGVGRVWDPASAIGLAQWLEGNPLGLPIEVKVGKPPTVRALEEDPYGEIIVRRVGGWLRVDGSVVFGGIKVSLGEMLEAARHARRYVRVGDGSFLELSKDALAKLAPLAAASTLALSVSTEAPNEGGAIVHDAFGSLVGAVSELFAKVDDTGVPLSEYLRRFQGRNRRVRIPKLGTGTLRDYQRAGVEWMLQLASWAPGCILADDMGLGKTVQTAAVLGARAKLGPALVIAPASVSSNWVAELERFMPSLTLHWYNEDRTTSFGELGAGDVVIVSYNLLQRQSAPFRETHWTTVVLDEAQYVKNVLAQRRDVVRNLPRDFTIALTGTPLENHLGELFSIVDIVFPGLLGDVITFRDTFRRTIEGSRDSDQLALLASLIGPFLLRRTRGSVLRELPPREDITELIDLSLAERKRYLALRKVCEQTVMRGRKEETPAQLRIALLAALTRLRQMACDVSLVEPEFKTTSTKIVRAVELARQLADEGNAVLVFSQFSQFLGKVRAALVEAGLRVAMLTGETPTSARRPIVDAFQEGKYDVFCVSLLAGGTGLNLTRASYVIHLDPWWNPAVEEQATSRAHRMGQTSPVTVYRLVSRGTIEEAVLEMHADKRDLAAAVLEGKATPRTVTAEDLFDLLRYGA